MANQKKLFILGMITTVGLMVAGYFIWQFITPGTVEFKIQGPKEVLAGETKTLRFIIENKTRLLLNEAQIKIMLPENVYDVNWNNTPTIMLDQLMPKEKIEKEIDITFFGNLKTKHKIETSFRYKPQGFSSLFEKKQPMEVLIAGSTIDLNVNNPTQVLPETNFDTTLFWTNQKDFEYRGLAVKINYPEEYILKSSDLEMALDKNIFDLGFVKAFQQGKINLSGSMRSQGGENKKFEIFVGVYLKDVEKFLIIKKIDSVVSLISNPLSLTTLINSQSNYNASVGETLNIKVAYQNNYNVPLNNLVLKVVFEGSYFDYKKLLPNKGYFTFGNKTITWGETQIPKLATLNPGERGEIDFTIGLLNNFNIKTLTDKNFVLKINASLESLTPPIELSAGSKIVASSSALAKLNADILLEIDGYFVDNRTTISNCGSLPVKVNEKTCFTVHLRAKNFANDVNNVIVTMNLPYYIAYTNKFTATYNNPDLTFDTFSKKLTWKLNNLPANSGVITKPYEIVFQIEVVPTISEARQNIDLLTNIQVEAMDSFTQNKISKSYRDLRLNNIYDVSLNSIYANVQE